MRNKRISFGIKGRIFAMKHEIKYGMNYKVKTYVRVWNCDLVGYVHSCNHY